jgi:hypothetical protein
MAATLQLTDTITTLDFVTPGSRYRLRNDGLHLPLPQVKRLTGGDVLLTEGEQLIERRYGNREITIDFNLIGSSHDDFIDAVRDLNKLIDIAKQTTVKSGLGRVVTLNYKMDNASETVAFDVLDAEFTVEDWASPVLRRANKSLDASLKLICRPFAHSVAPIEISNFLLNPSFDWNPGESGRDGVYYYTLGGAGQRLTYATAADLDMVSSNFLVAGWIRPTTLPGTTMSIAVCGSTQIGWKVYINGSNKLVFEWVDTGPTTRTLTSVTSVVDDQWVFFCAMIYTTSVSDSTTLLFMNDTLEASFHNATVLLMRAATGTFSIGATTSDTERFQGDVCGFVILTGASGVNTGPRPVMARHLYLYGLRSLWKNEANLYQQMPHHYWGFRNNEYGALWVFDENTQIRDRTENGRHLTLVGSPVATANRRKPKGWTMGTDFANSTGSGLAYDVRRYGLASLLFFDTGSATMTCSQTLTPITEQTFWTIWFWNLGGITGANLKLVDGGGTTTLAIPHNPVWSQHIVRRPVNGNLTVTFEQPSGSASARYIDGVVVCHGDPFNLGVSNTLSEVTGETVPTGIPKPFIGSKFLRSFPDTTKLHTLEYRDVPGDVPATCKLFFKNAEAMAAFSPVRIGMLADREPWKLNFLWRASWLVPNFAGGAAYATGINPNVTCGAGLSLADKVLVDLPRLFAFPSEQIGSFKAYIGYQCASTLINVCQLATKFGTFPLSGDPIQDSVAAVPNTHVVDGGILTWPPAIALGDLRSGELSSRPRDGNVQTPQLTIANIAEALIAAPNVAYNFLFLMPVEDGYFVQFPGSNAAHASLQAGEILVVNTIDRDAQTISYIAQQIDSPMNDTVHGLLASPDVSAFGSGFYLQPDKSGQFVFQWSEYTGLHFPYGMYKETLLAEAFFQYSPRYLYV